MKRSAERFIGHDFKGAKAGKLGELWLFDVSFFIGIQMLKNYVLLFPQLGYMM